MFEFQWSNFTDLVFEIQTNLAALNILLIAMSGSLHTLLHASATDIVFPNSPNYFLMMIHY